MSPLRKPEASSRLILQAETARDLMAPNPVGIRAEATVREAVALLTDKGFNAVPVFDDTGRPIGVLSRSDLLTHEREAGATAAESPTGKGHKRPAPGAGSGQAAGVQVRDLMTPALFSVSPQTAARKVVEEILALNVHGLFVVDDGGAIIGVISAVDVLKHLQPEA